MVDDNEDEVSEDEDVDRGTTAGAGAGITIGTLAGSALLCTSFINFDASACRLLICFWVVSKILDSTMTSYSLTPFT
jgi:hypothetical protein